MERRFGHDFGAVRVHTDSRASAAARALGARAFAVGPHLAFAAGRYAPQAAEGARLLAHELAHVVQGRQAPGGPGAEPVSSRGDPSEARADAAAARAAAGATVPPRSLGGTRAIVNRQAETWYHGWAVGVEPARPGGVIHDLGEGMYFSDRLDVAELYAGLRAGEAPATARTGAISLTREELGRVLDLTTDSRWQSYVQRREPAGQTIEELASAANEHYDSYFREFIREYQIQIEDFDAIIGPEYFRGGKQLCVQDPALIERLGVLLGRRTATPSRAPTTAEPGAAEPATEAAPAVPAQETAAPAATQYRVGAQYRVLNSARAGDSFVSEIEVVFTHGLDEVNAAASANGAGELPGRMVIRMTHTADGAVTAAEALTGEPAALAETVARQAVQALPRATGATESGAAAAGAAAARVSPWVRGIGWAGIVLFVGVTGYQLYTARPEQRPRVVATAAGGLAGGALSGYLVCNLLFGLESAGWSLLGCLFAAGAPGAYAGSELAGAAYDEASLTPVERALRGLEAQPVNVRVLFYSMVERAGSTGLPITERFVAEFIASVPANLSTDELSILLSRLEPIRPGDSLTSILADLRRTIDSLPERRPRLLPAQLAPPIRGLDETNARFRLDALGGRIRLLPGARQPPRGQPDPAPASFPILEVEL